jgi:hypothetical protein
MKLSRLSILMSAAAFCAVLSVQSSQAAVSIGVGINVAPPPDRVEVIPANPHPGWVWIRGHWGWVDGRWSWMPGHYMNPPRRGGAWIPGHWGHRDGRWVWVEGHWR